MTEQQGLFDCELTGEHVKAYRTAQEMLQCAKSWAPDARLMGNVRAGDIAELCELLMYSMESSHPIIHLLGVEILFWVCPNGCLGGVEWNDGVAVCQSCFESNQSKVQD